MSSEIPRCPLARLLDVDSHHLPTEVLNIIFSFLPLHPTPHELYDSKLNLDHATVLDVHPFHPLDWDFDPTNYDYDRDYYLRRTFFQDWNDKTVQLIGGFPKQPMVYRSGQLSYTPVFSVYIPNLSQIPDDMVEKDGQYFPLKLLPYKNVVNNEGLVGRVFIEGL